MILHAVHGQSSLVRFHHRQRIRAGVGSPGSRGQSTGKSGQDSRIPAPAGTVVFREDNGEILGDLVKAGDEIVVAHGGKGGLGNMHFKSSVHQTPQIALKGEPGESLWLRLELKLVADVGLVGCPNAGKSSLLARASAAHPKVAAYPFTTLTPVLGSVTLGDANMVIADIPGLIEGSHDGAGLGHDFLRHIERTRFIAHVIDCSGESGEPMTLYQQIVDELEAYSPALATRPSIVVANKLDLAEARENWPKLRDALADRGVEAYPISAATGEGLEELIRAVFSGASDAPEPDVFAGSRDVVLRPGLGQAAPTARRIGEDSLTLESAEAEKLAARIDFEVLDAALWFQKQLKRMGATSVLEEAGVKSGDTVKIGDLEFEWL